MALSQDGFIGSPLRFAHRFVGARMTRTKAWRWTLPSMSSKGSSWIWHRGRRQCFVVHNGVSQFP
jgi:hypothetical protein